MPVIDDNKYTKEIKEKEIKRNKEKNIKKKFWELLILKRE
jgi:hypothetical protein